MPKPEASELVEKVLDACDTLKEQGQFGPFKVTVPASCEVLLDQPYSVGKWLPAALADLTVRQRILRLDGIVAIEVAETGEVVVEQAQAPIVDDRLPVHLL